MFGLLVVEGTRGAGVARIAGMKGYGVRNGQRMQSPMVVFAMVLGCIFVGEAVIMLSFPGVKARGREWVVLAVTDALVLSGVMCPVLWMAVVRPLRRMVRERGDILARTLEIQEAERSRLARDLHDELGQVQTAILLGVRGVMNAPTMEAAGERAKGVHDLSVEAVEVTRRLARGLSPSLLADFGLGPALERVCEELAAASGLSIVRDIGIGGERFDPAVEIAMYRVGQEALTNAAKHAEASEIRLGLAVEKSDLVLAISDNGRGMAADVEEGDGVGSGSGMGLPGMRQRVELLGGEFSLASSNAQGTTIRARVPRA